jgi:hypothetical protein
MTKSADVVRAAADLAALGVSQAEISRRLGVSRAAVRVWLRADVTALIAQRATRGDGGCDGGCVHLNGLPGEAYVYLLGLYLGDGCLSRSAKGVYRLRVSCCDEYPRLMGACAAAMAAVMPNNKVGRVPCIGCTEVYSDSKHWLCLFPQHGAGRKHERPIELAAWQQAIVDQYPHELVRGLVHSDGCRCINRVTVRGKKYAYPRYFFNNNSADIRQIFGATCDRIGVEWRPNNKYSLSVARRASVAILDEFIGPKS